MCDPPQPEQRMGSLIYTRQPADCCPELRQPWRSIRSNVIRFDQCAKLLTFCPREQMHALRAPPVNAHISDHEGGLGVGGREAPAQPPKTHTRLAPTWDVGITRSTRIDTEVEV